jgi:hypothetical protein
MHIRRFWLLVVLMSLAATNLPAAKGSADSRSDESGKTRVSFELYQDYLIVVRGSVGPLKDLNFLLDTGATPSVLTPRLKEKLHLVTAPMDIAVLKGTVRGETATVPSLQFGSIRKDNVAVLIQDLSFLQKGIPVRLDGIVGLDVLGQSKFVIDYAAHEIRFGPASSMSDSIPFHIREGLAIVDAFVNQAQVHLLVDTGASSMILFEEMRDPASEAKAAGTGASPKAIGEFQRNQKRSINVKLGKTKFDHEVAFVVQNHRDAGHNFDGLMSPIALGITRVAVDLSQGTLAFTRKP